MARKQTRSSFDRPQGLGSARARRTLVDAAWPVLALIPLTLWFAASLIARARDDYGAVILWLHSPFTSVLMVLLLIALFYHMALGLQVVVEDYVHTDRIKMPTVIVIHLGCFALGAAGIVATLRVAFGR